MRTLLLEDRKTRVIGRVVPRKEDMRLVSGSGTFVSGMKKPRMLYMALVRSPYAHAKILSINTTKAARYRSVRAVLTWEDVKEAKYFWFTQREMKRVDCYALAAGKVRHVGEAVAAVLAETMEDAIEATELVEVEFEQLPVVVSAEDALKKGAPLLYDEWDDNVSMRVEMKSGDVDRVFGEADHIFEERLSIHRHSAAPIETRAYLADYDAREGSITLWATTQNPHLLRTILAESMSFSESKIRVIEPDVGGSFGAKMPSYPEELLVCLATRKLSRPVKFVETRSESLMSMHQAREQTHYLSIAVSRDGTILGIKDRVIGNLGISFPTTGPASLMTAARFVPSCYKLKAYQSEVIGVATNKPPYGAYRGFGKDAANFVIERVIDIVARRLALDPVNLRLKNLIGPEEMPYRSITGAVYDSGDYAACLNRAVRQIGYREFKRRQKLLRKKGRFQGVGIAVVLEPSASHFPGSIMMGYETATVRLLPTGSVVVLPGSTSTGTSHETVMAQIASDILGVKYDDVAVVEGDTDLTPYGFGNWASRSVVLGANAVYMACSKIRDKVLEIARYLLEEPNSELRLEDGSVVVVRTGKKIALKDVAHASYYMDQRIPRSIPPGLEATEHFFPPTLETVPKEDGTRNAYAAYGYSVNAALVEVDVQTGVTKVLRYIICADPGRILNPQVVEGQLLGGVTQGLGGVFLEENGYSGDGQPLAANFSDYTIPTALDVPNVEVSHTETASPFLPLGAKGAGEGGAEGVGATLVNAAEDALEPFGVSLRELSLKPERIWAQIKEAQRRTPSSASPGLREDLTSELGSGKS